MLLRLSRRAKLAGIAILAAVVGTTAGFAAVIGTVYQDMATGDTGTNSSSAAAKFKAASATQSLVIETVSCRIQATDPPFDVSLTSFNATQTYTDDLYLPVQFVGQSGSHNFYTVHSTNVHYGVAKGFKPMVRALFGTIGTVRWIRCTITGDLK